MSRFLQVCRQPEPTSLSSESSFFSPAWRSSLSALSGLAFPILSPSCPATALPQVHHSTNITGTSGPLCCPCSFCLHCPFLLCQPRPCTRPRLYISSLIPRVSLRPFPFPLEHFYPSLIALGTDLPIAVKGACLSPWPELPERKISCFLMAVFAQGVAHQQV